MPHVVVKMHQGRTEEQKQALADAITRALVEHTAAGESSVSIRIEDVDPADWAEAVYRPEILAMRSKLIRLPGYDPFQ
jgi:4-oxalocrotonate tautomerase